jgi:hypothetical protein
MPFLHGAGSQDIQPDKSPALEVNELPIPTPSCLAIKQALSTLFRTDDFLLEPLGCGFFSQVYKVCFSHY